MVLNVRKQLYIKTLHVFNIFYTLNNMIKKHEPLKFKNFNECMCNLKIYLDKADLDRFFFFLPKYFWQKTGLYKCSNFHSHKILF